MQIPRSVTFDAHELFYICSFFQPWVLFSALERLGRETCARRIERVSIGDAREGLVLDFVPKQEK